VENYHRWGPSVRTCFALAEGHVSPADMVMHTLRAALKFVLTQLPDSDTSNDLFSIHPMTSSRGIMGVTVATEHILDIILKQVTRLDATQQSQFFSMMCRDFQMESSFPSFYEKLMYLRLTGDPTATPLMCHPSTMGPPIAMPVVSNAISLSGSLNLNDANRNDLPFYWRPVSKDFMSFDAIICTLKNIFILKTTVSRTGGHYPKIRGLDFIREHIPTRFWNERQCYLVLITPDQDDATQLTSEVAEDYPELEVRYCVFPIGISTLTSLQLEKLHNL